jgi:Na+-driven multidrug efflux pump
LSKETPKTLGNSVVTVTGSVRELCAAAGKAAGAALKLTVLAALPAGVGLSVLAGPILQLLYPAVPETAEAAAYHLTFLGLACVFVCLMVATNGVLQAYGHPLLPVISVPLTRVMTSPA